MAKVASWTLVILLAACGVAHAKGGRKQPGKLSQWSSVQALQPGTLIEVLPGRQAGSDLCRVESTDDTALTCVAERPEGDTRLVFPRDGVLHVWVIERAKNLHIGQWIVLGVGVALVVAAGVELGVFGLATFGPLIVGIEASYFEFSVWRAPPQPPRMRRRLIYSVP